MVLDAEESRAQVVVDGMPDRSAFVSPVTGVLDRVRGAGFAGVRLFGEMVEVLRGRSFEAALQREALRNELLADQRVALLCAYRIDNFSAEAHRGVLQDISRAHSPLIPVDDYQRLGRAVERAYADVFGAMGNCEALRASVLSRYAGTSRMPAAEGALLALRDLSPTLADQVLARARYHYAVDQAVCASSTPPRSRVPSPSRPAASAQ